MTPSEQRLVVPKPGERVVAMGNTGEGKSEILRRIAAALPNVVILNTKGSPMYNDIAVPENDVEHLMHTYTGGRYVLNVWRDDAWMENEQPKDRFFSWAFSWAFANQKNDPNGLFVLIDEVNDICPSAQAYPIKFQKIIKQGREFGLGVLVGTQEPIRAPSFAFGQAQHLYVFHIGWDAHRKVVNGWFEGNVPWQLLPAGQHKFLYKARGRIVGPLKLDLQAEERAPVEGSAAS